MSTSASLLELLASCGLENRAKLFEDEGYTLEIAMKAVRDDQTTLLNDLRELKLPMDECRKLMEALAAADNAGIPHAGEAGACAHEQIATTDARATEEAKVMAAGGAIPTAAVTIEMEPAPAKETNSPSPKASNQDTLIADIGHIISWVVALGIGFYMASKTQGGGGRGWFFLAPVCQLFALLLVGYSLLDKDGDCGGGCTGDCTSFARALYDQLLVLLALASFGLSIVVGGFAITFGGLSAEDLSGAGGMYILFSANATAFALINVSQRLVLKARSTPQP